MARKVRAVKKGTSKNTVKGFLKRKSDAKRTPRTSLV